MEIHYSIQKVQKRHLLDKNTDKSTLREEILAGRNFGGFGGLVQKPPNSANISSRQKKSFFGSAKINSRQIQFLGPIIEILF